MRFFFRFGPTNGTHGVAQMAAKRRIRTGDKVPSVDSALAPQRTTKNQ
jgi:hypothetical protein